MSVKRVFAFKELNFKRTADLTLNEEEGRYFSDIAQEHVNIAGTYIDYYHLDIAKSIKDPLYDEASEREFIGPYRMKAYVSYPEQQPTVEAQGTILNWDCIAWISRRDIEEKKAPPPAPGDVIRIWKIPFFQDAASFDETIPGAAFYFNVLNSNTDGHLFDTSTFVGFRVTLRRRTDMAPERRISNK